MGKLLIIGILVLAFIYLILRRFNIFNNVTNTYSSNQNRNGIIEIGIPIRMLKSTVKKTLITIGSGIFILLITLVLAAKFKIALIMLPISLYLIGQYFLLSNHIKAIRSQRIVFDVNTNDVMVELSDRNVFSFNLDRDIKSLKEYKSVQKNNGIEFGFYQLKTNGNTINIPHLVLNNAQTKPFFDKLHHLDRQIETKLFPII